MVTSYYAVDTTTLFLSWSAPPLDQQNGIIRRYDISLLEIETGSTFSYTAMNTNLTINMLHPDYQYQIEISTVTVGTGPSSTPVVLQMPEDGMDFVLALDTRVMLLLDSYYTISMVYSS